MYTSNSWSKAPREKVRNCCPRPEKAVASSLEAAGLRQVRYPAAIGRKGEGAQGWAVHTEERGD